MSGLRVNVADLLHHAGSRRALMLEEPIEGLAAGAARIADDQPVRLELTLERVPHGIVVRGTVSTRWSGQCGVCLSPVERDLAVAVNELFEPSPLEAETYPLEGHELDLEQLVRDAVLLELPLALVCDETNGCPEHDEVLVAAADADTDPRWAALSQLELS